MITDFIIGAFVSGIGALLSLVPSVTIPDAGETFTQFAGVIGRANKVFPILVAVTCLGAIVTLKIALTAWEFIVFVYHQFWGSE